MKKIFLLMAFIMPLFLSSCSSSSDDDNDYKSQFIGTWIEDTNETFEVFNLELNSDNTGYQWTTDNGRLIYEKEHFIWSVTKNKIRVTLDKGGSAELSYQFQNGKLYIYNTDETIIYKRK